MTLRESLERLDSEELLERVIRKSLTDDAEKVACEILVSRGITPPKVDEYEPIQINKPPLHARIVELVKACISGHASLSEAYWNLGLILFAMAIVAMIGYSFTIQGFLGNAFAALLIIAIVVGNPFHAYCVWKCRKNTNSQFWELIAGIYAGLQLIVFCGLLPIALIGSFFQ